MKIKKTYQSIVPNNIVQNTHDESTNNVYSCDYTNRLLIMQNATISVGAIGPQSGQFDKNININIPSGYKAVGIVGWNLVGGNSASINIARLQVNVNKVEYSLFNSSTTGTSASTSTLYVQVLYMKI